MNRITDKINTGTVGEMLVQIRLLQYGVQAAPPIKDTGNDLIAVKGSQFRAVSIKTTTGIYYNKPDNDRAYHFLAVVQLLGDDRHIRLDDSQIFLIPKEDVASAPLNCAKLSPYKFSEELVESLFGATRQMT